MKDIQLERLVKKEEERQKNGIDLIPSENHASSYVRSFLSSVFGNKYSEGYPKKRYYGGNEWVDDVELLAQKRAQKLFHVPFVNVQPYSGSPANLAVYLSVCKPGDTIMGQALTAGGHLTHGHPVSATGMFYKSIQYKVKNPHFAKASRGEQNSKVKNSIENDLFDYDEIKKLAETHRPKLIWVGATAYPLIFHYDRFAEIADEIGCYLAADISHVAGLIAAGVHPSPAEHTHIITTTTHKTLRGPRGALIMVTHKGLKKDPELGDKINKAVFPGLQGGPHDHQTAAIAAALHEAAQPSFATYGRQIVKNTRILAQTLIHGGLNLVGGGTENHLILVDLSPTHGPGTGVFAQKALDAVRLTVNKNTVPGEPSSPFYPSGIRLGTPAATTRCMKEHEMEAIGKIIGKTLHEIKKYKLPHEKTKRIAYLAHFEKEIRFSKTLKKLATKVRAIAIRFPIP